MQSLILRGILLLLRYHVQGKWTAKLMKEMEAFERHAIHEINKTPEVEEG